MYKVALFNAETSTRLVAQLLLVGTGMRLEVKVIISVRRRRFIHPQ